MDSSEIGKKAAGLYDTHGQKVRYLIVGGWNTVFGYGVFAALWMLFGQHVHYVALVTISYAIAITHNFVLFKFFVFRTRGRWLTEYLRMYVVYAGAYVANLVLLTVLYQLLGLPMLLAQLVSTFVVIMISYVGHRSFTFCSQENALAGVQAGTPAGADAAAGADTNPARENPAATRAEALLYGAVGLTAWALVTWALQLWRADWRVPFTSGGDATFLGAMVKGMIEHGWYLTNPSLGFPGVLAMQDYPSADLFHVAMMKALSWVVGSWGATVNVYYVLTFPAIALTALWAARRFGLGRLAAAVVALLYAFQPYHFARGQGHLFLAAYFMVPVGAVFALRALDGSLGVPDRSLWRAVRDAVRRPRAVAATLALVAIGMTGIYYALFTCFFVLVAVCVRAWRAGRVHELWAGAWPIVSVIVGVMVSLAPSIIYRLQHGPNPGAVERGAIGAEIYALKINHLLLPVTGHRVEPMGAVTSKYLDSLASFHPVLPGEAWSSAIGLVAAVGFVALVAVALFGFYGAGHGRGGDLAGGVSSSGPLATRLHDLATLNLAALLLATVGSFGALVAVVVPQIRAYNRISIFIAFFALLAVGLFLDAAGPRLGRVAAVLLALGVLGAGLLDQTTPGMAPRYAQNEAIYSAQAAFVQKVESSLPPGAAVLQLPYVPFPENPPVVRMQDYDHFVGYLHSSKLKWSYGAMKGRETDAWLRDVSALPVRQMLEAVYAKGFRAVWVDTFGYEDDGAAVIAELTANTKRQPLRSAEGRYVVFLLP